MDRLRKMRGRLLCQSIVFFKFPIKRKKKWHPFGMEFIKKWREYLAFEYVPYGITQLSFIISLRD